MNAEADGQFDIPLILVAGGTGTLGKLLVPRLQQSGYKIRILSRKTQPSERGIEYVTGDLAKGEGIEAAVKGAEIVVHCAGSAKGDEVKTENLVNAAKKAGVKHLVYISVVGDRPGAGRERYRPRHVRVLRIQAVFRAHRGGVRHSLDDPSSHPVPRGDADGRVSHGQDAVRPCAQGLFIPAHRRQ